MAAEDAEPLPPLYARWALELLDEPIPREARATCETCPMCAPPAQTPDFKRVFFDPAIKCCTYLPTLYNFLAGRVLADDDPAAAAGRQTVQKRIAAGLGVSPLGLMAWPTYSLAYGAAEGAFGRAHALKCPHLLQDSGRCGVWRHRESTCATWFCKHVRGRVAFDFWRDGLHRFLTAVEIDLARWCVLEVGVSEAVLRESADSDAWDGRAEPLDAAGLDHRIDEAAYQRLWGAWRERESDFYRRCAELVSPLSLAEVLAICGPEVRAQARLTRDAFAKLMRQEVPAALEVGAFRVVERLQGATRLVTYSEYDPVDAPDAILSVLPSFDGRPTDEVLSALAEERGIQMSPDLVRKLVDFDILTEPAKR